jgi:hypothetical protein
MVTASQALVARSSSSIGRGRGDASRQKQKDVEAEESAAFWKRPKGVVRTESSKTESHYNIPASYDAIWKNACDPMGKNGQAAGGADAVAKAQAARWRERPKSAGPQRPKSAGRQRPKSAGGKRPATAGRPADPRRIAELAQATRPRSASVVVKPKPAAQCQVHKEYSAAQLIAAARHANATGGGGKTPPTASPQRKSYSAAQLAASRQPPGGQPAASPPEHGRKPPRPRQASGAAFLRKGKGTQSSDAAARSKRPQQFQSTNDGLCMENGTVDSVRVNGTRAVPLSKTDSMTVRCSGAYPHWGGEDNYPFRGYDDKERFVGGEWVRYGPAKKDRGKPRKKKPGEVYNGINKDLGEYKENPRLDGWRFQTSRGKTAAAEALCNPKYNCHTPEQRAQNLARARRPRQDGGPRESLMMGRAHEDSSGAKTALMPQEPTKLGPGCRSVRHLVADWPDGSS